MGRSSEVLGDRALRVANLQGCHIVVPFMIKSIEIANVVNCRVFVAGCSGAVEVSACHDSQLVLAR